MKKRAAAMLFQYSNNKNDHFYIDDIDKDEKRIDNSNSNKRGKSGMWESESNPRWTHSAQLQRDDC